MNGLSPLNEHIPARIARLPVDPSRPQFPVPWFVVWLSGKPDFRIVGPGKFNAALRGRRCWICGELRGLREGAFTVGPMCAINRTSAEPPSHPGCAIYAATHCPFLTKPHMRRREKGLPDGTVEPAGEMIRHNPGVTLVWITRRWSLFPDGQGGNLIHIGDPLETLWFAEGRPATRAEVEASIESGLPLLREVAGKDPDATGALAELERARLRALQYLPAEGPQVEAAR